MHNAVEAPHRTTAWLRRRSRLRLGCQVLREPGGPEGTGVNRSATVEPNTHPPIHSPSPHNPLCMIFILATRPQPSGQGAGECNCRRAIRTAPIFGPKGLVGWVQQVPLLMPLHCTIHPPKCHHSSASWAHRLRARPLGRSSSKPCVCCCAFKNLSQSFRQLRLNSCPAGLQSMTCILGNLEHSDNTEQLSPSPFSLSLYNPAGGTPYPV
jgi:hypothetical protein